MWILTAPGSASAAQVKAATESYAQRIRQRTLGHAFPYDNTIDAYATVTCTDGKHPSDASKWPAQAAAADRTAPYFGRAWAWASVQCARNTWTVRDEDAYTGPWTTRTKNTVLIVGSYFDPATNYYDAVKASTLLPNSRLLSSNNWGHTAYGTSSCATGYVDRYLLYKDLPPKGKVCVGDQPFTAAPAAATTSSLRSMSVDDIVADGLPAAGSPKQLPPVTPLLGR